MAILSEGPLFQVIPLRKARVGILVTGSEVFDGLVEDRFIPIIGAKVQRYDCEVVQAQVVPDDREAIRVGIMDLVQSGADLVVTTAGLSVDPDDVTRLGLLDAGVTEMTYGAPVLPGAMTLLARLGAVQIIGVPACALYFKTTSFRPVAAQVAGRSQNFPPRPGKAGTRSILHPVQILHLSQVPVRHMREQNGLAVDRNFTVFTPLQRQWLVSM